MSQVAKAKVRRLVEAQQNHCFYCGLAFGTPVAYDYWPEGIRLRAVSDHVVPQSRAPSQGDRNLVAACQVCNQWKGKLLWRSLEAIRASIAEHQRFSRFRVLEGPTVHPERLRALVAQLQVMKKYQQLSCLEIAARLNEAQEPTLSGEWRWFDRDVWELLHDPSRGAL
jgi:hypothetical protein